MRDLILAGPLLSLLALLAWVILAGDPQAPVEPPLTAPSASVSASQHPSGP